MFGAATICSRSETVRVWRVMNKICTVCLITRQVLFDRTMARLEEMWEREGFECAVGVLRARCKVFIYRVEYSNVLEIREV